MSTLLWLTLERVPTPPLCQTCLGFFPWTLFRETTVKLLGQLIFGPCHNILRPSLIQLYSIHTARNQKPEVEKA